MLEKDSVSNTWDQGCMTKRPKEPLTPTLWPSVCVPCIFQRCYVTFLKQHLFISLVGEVLQVLLDTKPLHIDKRGLSSAVKITAPAAIVKSQGHCIVDFCGKFAWARHHILYSRQAQTHTKRTTEKCDRIGRFFYTFWRRRRQEKINKKTMGPWKRRNKREAFQKHFWTLQIKASVGKGKACMHREEK